MNTDMHVTQQLNPITVYLIWTIALSSIAYANYKSATEAWCQASDLHPRRNWQFFLSFFAREQIAYAKRIPRLLAIALMLCLIAVILPFS